MSDESWIEEAVYEMWPCAINGTRAKAIDIIRRHHACPAVTAERLLAQVEAIAQGLKVVPDVEMVARAWNIKWQEAIKERDKWKQEVTEAMGLLMQVGNSGTGLVKRVAKLLEERDEARAECELLKAKLFEECGHQIP